MEMGHPRWFHPLGKNVVVEKVVQNHSVKFRSGGSTMTIRARDGSRFRVEWNITWVDGGVNGSVLMSGDELAAAFGFYNTHVDFCERRHLEETYGATVACAGKFIRTGDFLNIPGPGIGNNGDPNYSVWLTQPVKSAVLEKLLGIPAF